MDLFKQRVVKYWNMLPCEVKEAISVNDFKAKLEYHKLTNLGRDGTNRYWDLSDEIFNRI